MLLRCWASLSIVLLSVSATSARSSHDQPLHNLVLKPRVPFFWRRPDAPLARVIRGLFSETGLLAKLIQPRATSDLMPRNLDFAVATPRRVTKDWLVNEIFDGVVAYFKWNILGRISETLIEDLLVEVLDPKLREIMPRDIATKILNVLFKKFQFFLMFVLNSMFANF